MSILTTAFQALSLRGVDVIKQVCDMVAESSVTHVAGKLGCKKTQVRHFLWLWSVCGQDQTYAIAKECELSLTVVEEIVKGVNRVAKTRDMCVDFCTLAAEVKGLDADSATAVIKDHVRSWKATTATEAKPDYGHMHTEVEADGKRRLVVRLRDDRASEVDRVLHRKAKQLMHNSTSKLPYAVAYAQALYAQVVTPVVATATVESNDPPMARALQAVDKLVTGGHAPLFAPMFIIPTDCHYFSDGRIATVAGGLVDLEQLVNEPLADTGYAALLAKDEDGTAQVMQLIPVKHQGTDRSAGQIIRLISTLMHLKCVHPGCSRAAAKCQQHHVISYATGGLTTIRNIVPLCATDNGLNDDDPSKPPKHGRIEYHPTTGTPGHAAYPGAELKYNQHPLVAKSIRRFATDYYRLE